MRKRRRKNSSKSGGESCIVRIQHIQEVSEKMRNRTHRATNEEDKTTTHDFVSVSSGEAVPHAMRHKRNVSVTNKPSAWSAIGARTLFDVKEKMS